ncbi:urease accessory protein UreF [Kamptonema formosum]|uniref:urease accessory protein UreF n=1 Tax=Kamptonema formosum TaxID=331992 RepID=UPI000346A7B5|nr:urease accessory protein UreF [Oscillatoria sp. PCC 10802]
MIELNDFALLSLLQLASSALPVGAYSYSEGLETLIATGTIDSRQSLERWLAHCLRYGAVRVEAAVMVRALRAAGTGDLEALAYWNAWATATRETEELRQQSWQMGSALSRLLVALEPQLQVPVSACGSPCNFSVAMGIAAAHWQIDEFAAVLGYLHSWASNLIGAGVKLIPLGQTAGQHLLLNSHPALIHAAREILSLDDESLSCTGWGLSLASMNHETLYARLFRS